MPSIEVATRGRVHLEAADLIGYAEPCVLVFRPDRLLWLAKTGIEESADGDTDKIRRPLGFPINVGAALDAKMECNRPATCGVTCEGARHSLICHRCAVIEGCDAEGTARPTLTIHAMRGKRGEVRPHTSIAIVRSDSGHFSSWVMSLSSYPVLRP